MLNKYGRLFVRPHLSTKKLIPFNPWDSEVLLWDDDIIQAIESHLHAGNLQYLNYICQEILETHPRDVIRLITMSMNKSLQTNQSRDESCYVLATAFKEIWRLDDAVTFYQKTLQINPNHPKARKNLRKALKKSIRHKEDVKCSLTNNVQLNINTSDGDEASHDTISLCMIVKNEEMNIERCLMSIKPAVHEMIVVDTGSTDRTKDIAKACGAQVYDFEWTNDFSAARNFSLSKASCNWVLILDADEIISSIDHKAFRELAQKKTNSKIIAYQMTKRNYVDTVHTEWVANDGKYSREEAGVGWVPTERVQLFTNDKGIQFENQVHELVEPSLSRLGVEIMKSNIPIHHYGHLNPEKKKFKEGYYYLLAQKKFIESDTDLRAIYQLAVSSREFGKYEEALQYWKKFIAIKPDFPTAYCEMATNYALSGRYEEALLSLRRALQLDPTSRDIITMYAECEIIIGNLETAIYHLANFLRNDSTYPMAILALVAAYFCAGKKEEGLNYVEKLRGMHINFTCADYLSDFAKTLISVKKINYAHSLLEAAVASNNITNETPILLDECAKRLLTSEQ